jgi:serine/threonine protein kinase/WD40 repeat protein
MSAEAPKTVRGYELRECIGEGGFGAVYRAYQAVVDREVAVKVILPEYANDPDFIRNFETEARLIARLEHPFIVPLFDYWREPDGAYLVMRFFQAGSLSRMLKDQGALPVEKVAELLGQIGGALDTAHRHQVIHRDIKPENILMDEEGNTYLADFGIAKKVDQEKPANPEPENFSGTLLYAAPELLRSQPATALSDIYALGFVAYEMLTGTHPFADENPLMMLMSHLERSLPAVESAPPGVNAALWKATAKEPEERYASARLFAREFQEAIQPLTPSATPKKLIDLDLISLDEPVNPYKGLMAFEEADAMDFFGRQALVEQLLAHLAAPLPPDAEGVKTVRFLNDNRALIENRFIAVVGPSGSGKSSVVHAGLLPALRSGRLPGADEWFILTMTPGSRPIQQLKTTLLSIATDPSDTLSGKLQSGPRGLLQAIDEVLEIKQDLLLVIDQFEEVFTLVEDEQERQHFLELLYTAITAPESHLRLVITLRADFYDRPLLYENFGALVQARTQVVLPLSAEELEQAITGPARRAGLACDTDLVAAIVTDVRQEPGALPLLQYALTEVFERSATDNWEGSRLTLDAYQKSGRVLGALARRAEEVYNGLNADQQAVAKQIFLRLVTPGEGAEDTRRRARYSELTALKISQTMVQSVLDAFGKYRLLTFDHDSETREPTIEVAHEALIRGWNRLRKWLNQNRSDIRLQRMLAAAAGDWRGGKRDKSYLLRGTRLAQFEEWAKTSTLSLSQEEQAFLEASSAEHRQQQAAEAEQQKRELALERRSRQRLQVIVAVLILASIVGIILTAAVYGQSQIADQARQLADQQRQLAEQQSQLAQQQRDLAQRNADEANSARLATVAEQSYSSGDTITALSQAVEAATSLDNPPAEVLDTLVKIAYAPGLRSILDTGNQAITAIAISPGNRYVLSGSGVTQWQGSIGSGGPQSNGGPAGGQPGQPPPGGQPPSSGGQPPAGQSQNNGSPAASNNALILWDTQTGHPVLHLTDQSAPFSDIVFLPTQDETASLKAITASLDGNITLWDALTGHKLNQTNIPPPQRITLSLSADGSLLLIVGGNGPESAAPGVQMLWDVQNWQPSSIAAPPPVGILWTGALSPDGLTAVSSYGAGQQVVWDTQTGQELHRFDAPGEGVKAPGYRVTISPDGHTEAMNVGAPVVPLWNIQSNQSAGSLQAATTTTLGALFNGNGSELLLVSRDGRLRLWNVASGTEVYDRRSDGAFESAAFSADGRLAVMGTSDGSLYFWDMEATPIRQTGQIESGETKQAAYLPGGNQILSLQTQGGSQGLTSRLTVWDAATGATVRAIPLNHIYMPQAMAVSPDGRLALTGTVANVPGVPRRPGMNDAVILTNIETGQEVRRFDTPNNILALAFDPTSGRDGQPARAFIPQGSDLALYEVESGRQVQMYQGSTEPVGAFDVSPDGQTLAALDHSGNLRFWDVKSGNLTHQINVGGGGAFLRFSPDGQTLAMGSGQTDISLRDLNGTEIRKLTGHTNNVISFAFSPDGTLAASGSADNTAILWDIATGSVIRRYTEPQAIVWDVVFSPDQKTFLSAANSIVEWRTAPVTLAEVQSWLAANRYIANDNSGSSS